MSEGSQSVSKKPIPVISNEAERREKSLKYAIAAQTDFSPAPRNDTYWTCSQRKVPADEYNPIGFDLSSRNIKKGCLFFQCSQSEVGNETHGEQYYPPDADLGISGMSEEFRDDMETGEGSDYGKETRVFSLEDFSKGKGSVRAVPAVGPRHKRGRFFRPLEIGIAEFSSQKLLFGKSDAFIIYPEQEASDQGKPPYSYKQQQTENHDQVSQVKRMSNDGIDAGGIEHAGDLFLSVSP